MAYVRVYVCTCVRTCVIEFCPGCISAAIRSSPLIFLRERVLWPEGVHRHISFVMCWLLIAKNDFN